MFNIMPSTKTADCWTKRPPELKIEISMKDISWTTGPNLRLLHINVPHNALYQKTVTKNALLQWTKWPTELNIELSLDNNLLLNHYCPASQKWQWRRVLLTIVKWTINLYTPLEPMRIDRSLVLILSTG